MINNKTITGIYQLIPTAFSIGWKNGTNIQTDPVEARQVSLCWKLMLKTLFYAHKSDINIFVMYIHGSPQGTTYILQLLAMLFIRCSG